MPKKYRCLIICRICGEEIKTKPSYTRLGRIIKVKLAQRKHWHTKAEVYLKEATGIYYPTTSKNKI